MSRFPRVPEVASMTDDLIYYTRCPVPTATGLAVGLGTLEAALRDRHDATLVALQDVADPALRLHHFDHELGSLFREGGNIPALWAFSRGAPTRLLGITWLDEYQAIVTFPSSPVRELGDLAGRRVSAPSSASAIVDVARASTLRGFEQALGTVGLRLEDVHVVDAPREPMTGPTSDGRGEHFDAELELLAAGEVDAVWLKGAGGVAAVRKRGLAEVFRIDLHPDPLVRVNNGTPRALTVRQELIDERPELVRTYLRTLLDGPWRVRDRRHLWEALSSETHESVEDAEIAYRRVAPDSLVPSLREPRVRALQHQADFLFDHGFIPNRVDVDSWALDLRAACVGTPGRSEAALSLADRSRAVGVADA
jgi:ABC-type nitrate/sulfonate/bicarbonate transport system substrate-binding protein